MMETARRWMLLATLAMCGAVCADGNGRALDEALARMKEEGKPGVVLVVPSGEAQRVGFEQALTFTLREGGTGAKRLLCEAVFACASPRQVAARYEGEGSDARLILLDADGRIVGERPCDPKGLREGFEQTVGGLLDGEDGARLTDRAEKERQALGAEKAKQLDDALAALSDPDFDARDAATRTLITLAPHAIAALAVALAQASDAESQSRIQQVFDVTFASARQPFGTIWERRVMELNCVGSNPIIEDRMLLRFTFDE